MTEVVPPYILVHNVASYEYSYWTTANAHTTYCIVHTTHSAPLDSSSPVQEQTFGFTLSVLGRHRRVIAVYSIVARPLCRVLPGQSGAVHVE